VTENSRFGEPDRDGTFEDLSGEVHDVLVRLLHDQNIRCACVYGFADDACTLIAALGAKPPAALPPFLGGYGGGEVEDYVGNLEVLRQSGLVTWHALFVDGIKVGLLGLGKRHIDIESSLIGHGIEWEVRQLRLLLAYDVIRRRSATADAKAEQLGLLVNDLISVARDLLALRSEHDVITTMTYRLMGRLMVSEIALVVRAADGAIQVFERKNPRQHLYELFEPCSLLPSTTTVSNMPDGDVRATFIEHGIGLVVPIRMHGVYQGCLLCGDRLDGQDLRIHQIAFAEAVAVTAVAVLENLRLVREEVQKRVFDSELQIAMDIQRNLLPVQLPETPMLSIAAHTSAARGVSGDYYDVIELSDDRTLIAIADVAGKGIPAAILMANVQAALNILARLNLPLAELAARLNTLLCDNTEVEVFVTMFLAVVDPHNNELSYVNAGHNPPVLVGAHNSQLLTEGGPLLGVIPTPPTYVTGRQTFISGDLLALYTDGVTEAGASRNEEFGLDRLIGVLSVCKRQTSSVILDTLVQSIQAHAHPHPPDDDHSLLIIKRT
jgi:sigma-B regulation protein RsbU (phosphoserine phosphatase)